MGGGTRHAASPCRQRTTTRPQTTCTRALRAVQCALKTAPSLTAVPPQLRPRCCHGTYAGHDVLVCLSSLSAIRCVPFTLLMSCASHGNVSVALDMLYSY